MHRCLLFCNKSIPFQYLLKRAFPLYRNFRRLPSICFCCSYKSIATPHLWLLREEKKAGSSYSFFHFFSSSSVLYVSCNSTTSNLFVLKYWDILFLLFLFCRPLTLVKLCLSFPYREIYLLTYLFALCSRKKCFLPGSNPWLLVLCLFKIPRGYRHSPTVLLQFKYLDGRMLSN